MITYLLIFLGWLLGQLLFVVVMSIITQRKQTNNLTFNQAFAVYVKKDTGPIYAAAIIMLIVVFILPEVIAHLSVSNGPGELSKTHRYLTVIVDWIRTFSVVLGLLSQGLGFLAVSQSGKWIKWMETKSNPKP